MQTSNVVATEGLTVRLGSRVVLSELSVCVPAGAVGLLGPNGAGKTTLIRVLLGLLPPQRGRVSVLGMSSRRDFRRIREAVGYMPEDPVALPRRDAVESVALLAEMSGLPRQAALQRTHEVLWYVGLGEARYRPVEDFSTGMKQRFKLAAALVHDPKLLILDEPTNGLDPAGRREMLELLADLARHHGKSLLLSTHLLGDVEEVCSEVVVLDAGRLVRQARVQSGRADGRRIYRVRVSGSPDEYALRLRQVGLAAERSGEWVEVALGEGAATAPLFSAARAADMLVRALEPRPAGFAEQLADWLGAR
ncbi:ABC transporter ATP-binding protein [bacterium]|nr:ABC transporter ATP-binding protein [bacterium]